MTPQTSDAVSVWQAKLAHLEKELAITGNAEQKFELRQRIKECHKEIERLTQDPR